MLKEQLEWIGHMNQDPVKFWKDLKELLVEAGYDVNDNGTPAPVEKSIPPEWADIPESFISKFNEMETLVSTLTGQVTETKAEMERRQAKEELDTYLGTMHTKHGKFDDTYVIAQMALGVDAEKAIEAFQSMLKEYGAVEPKNTNPGNTNNNPPAPKVITGGGNVVQGEQDIRKLDDRSRRAFLIKALEQASGE